MVRKRKLSNGKLTSTYSYEFQLDGKRYSGRCIGCSTQREALEYERERRELIQQLAKEKDAKRLVENFKDHLTGGSSILIKDGFVESCKKPRKRDLTDDRKSVKEAHWRDFTAFMQEKYPDCAKLSQVTRQHAEDYLAYLRKNGRFSPITTYSRNGRAIVTQNDRTLSATTIGSYQNTLSEVFTLLADDAGIVKNPFLGIPKPLKHPETREAFTAEEIKTILDNADSFTRPLFVIALGTALREGDICNLKWHDIDIANGIIHKKTSKTGATVDIPMLLGLADYFLELQKIPCNINGFEEYVLPQQAQMYQTNRTGVSSRIKKMLETLCNITTTKTSKSGGRAISIKDLHSCRHTFCYYAGINGIPLTVVQSIVGHMTPEMTKLYSAHATIEDKKRMIQKLPPFLISGAAHSSMLPEINTETDSPSPALLLEEISDDPEKKQILESILGTISSWSTNRLTSLQDYVTSMPEQGELF